jgi:hypothetical protein
MHCESHNTLHVPSCLGEIENMENDDKKMQNRKTNTFLKMCSDFGARALLKMFAMYTHKECNHVW